MEDSKMKYLIFDAGPIISLTLNGMLPVLEKLKENFDGEFIITPRVKNEIVDKPLKVKKYKLEAIQVQELIRRKILKMSTEFIPQSKMDKEVRRIEKVTNGILTEHDTREKIKIIHEGEASCMAFSNLCGAENLIVIDERTTRMLTEAPQNLEKMIERKLHTNLDANLDLIKELKNFKYIRSAELLYIAYKKNLIPIKKDKNLLDALLYGVKFKGAAISSSEIEEIKNLA
jgi:hypothetical protein